MSNENIVGYQVCPNECGEIRSILQGKSKRAKYLYANCPSCKMDQSTGPIPQSKMKKYVTLEEAQAQLDAINQKAAAEENDNTPPKKEKKGISIWGLVGGVCVVGAGIYKVMRG